MSWVPCGKGRYAFALLSPRPHVSAGLCRGRVLLSPTDLQRGLCLPFERGKVPAGS